MLTKRKLKKMVADLQLELASEKDLVECFENVSVKYENLYYKQLVKNDKLKCKLKRAIDYINELEDDIANLKYENKKRQYKPDIDKYAMGVTYDKACSIVLDIDGEWIEL